jgi:hypothetical protein
MYEDPNRERSGLSMGERFLLMALLLLVWPAVALAYGARRLFPLRAGKVQRKIWAAGIMVSGPVVLLLFVFGHPLEAVQQVLTDLIDLLTGQMTPVMVWHVLFVWLLAVPLFPVAAVIWEVFSSRSAQRQVVSQANERTEKLIARSQRAAEYLQKKPVPDVIEGVAIFGRSVEREE